MRIRVSPAVNGGGIVGRLFWDFDGADYLAAGERMLSLWRGLWHGTGGGVQG